MKAKLSILLTNGSVLPCAPGPAHPHPASRGAYKKAGEGFSLRTSSDRIRGNGFKLKQSRFKIGIRKKFSTVRVVRHRHRVPREEVAAPSLEKFKAQLDGALSSSWCEVSLPWIGTG